MNFKDARVVHSLKTSYARWLTDAEGTARHVAGTLAATGEFTPSPGPKLIESREIDYDDFRENRESDLTAASR
ncbi:MAG: hypothetical protein NXI16_04830 [Alphaproteobacteria bacterium]|nr:hypothetical protein [Alphaproteobacteria bacterium]